ncbi:unnamed protein product [Paramecium sonneborni]|uniref:Uncharacterized protein n=1 Tax=Paramecium sonneborni TaxID=65129 RepID=A0A8S1NW85_9CILI|nr:unnamed protein product [Paramecium sonneborni]
MKNNLYTTFTWPDMNQEQTNEFDPSQWSLGRFEIDCYLGNGKFGEGYLVKQIIIFILIMEREKQFILAFNQIYIN